MTYHNALKYLASAPTYAQEDRPNERLRYLLFLLHDPHKTMRYLRLAGSSGKTICGTMLSEIFQRTELSVGTVVTSEDKDPRLAIRVGTQSISMEQVCHYFSQIHAMVIALKKSVTEQNQTEADAMETVDRAENEHPPIPESIADGTVSFEPTASEIILMAALLYFRDQNCSLCVIESNHKGVDPSVALPTPLSVVICGTVPKGDTAELAYVQRYVQNGIREIVSAPQDGDAYRWLSNACASVHCRLSIPVKASFQLQRHTLHGIQFLYREREYHLRLCGLFQMINAGTVIETVEMLRRCGFAISSHAEEEGLSRTRVAARFELLSSSPYIMVDSTHQADAMQTICTALQDFQDMLGKNIKLVLPPNRELSVLYREKLSAVGFCVDQIFYVAKKGEQMLTEGEHETVICETPKAVRRILSEMRQEDFWLIVGKPDFAGSVRYELLRQMGF